ncbi:MAG: flagellar hook-basal body protein [Verrucomicrobia bacterium]|nr:flagellar hook-basal body protein [Verrucomicrobiota bacterium]
MNVSLYQAAAAMNANTRWQEIITQNLNSGSTTAYKKQDISFAAIQAGHSLSQTGGAAFMPRATASTNFGQGDVTPTGNATDFAIDGSGFVEIEFPNGTRAYTRGGGFRLNTDGDLVTAQGYTIMGDRGPIRLNPKDQSFTVDPDGQVRQGGETKGQINLVEFNHPRLLTPIGAGTFLANNPALVQSPAADATLLQGSVEGSNASALVEMANLVTSMRHFEANQRVLTSEDERMGRVINALGSPT